MYIFYTPEISTTCELPEIEAQHCIRVLRLKEGDQIQLTDGMGHFYRAQIVQASAKHCMVNVLETIEHPTPWEYRLEIAIAPTKNMDRIEWFAEKATEIGINKISFLNCRFSERKEIKTSRIEKVLISAMKQSMKANLPELQDMTDFTKFISQGFSGKKFVAHCYSGEKPLLSCAYNKGENALVLIGPEGDFSEEEVAKAIANGFQPVSLGNSRLRTETAALAACQTIHVINEINVLNR